MWILPRQLHTLAFVPGTEASFRQPPNSHGEPFWTQWQRNTLKKRQFPKAHRLGINQNNTIKMSEEIPNQEAPAADETHAEAPTEASATPETSTETPSTPDAENIEDAASLGLHLPDPVNEAESIIARISDFSSLEAQAARKCLTKMVAIIKGQRLLINAMEEGLQTEITTDQAVS